MQSFMASIRHFKNRYISSGATDKILQPQWEIWPTPLLGAEITILSAVLQPTSAVGTNMADMKHDEDAVTGDGMVEIRVLVPSENKVYTVIFQDVFSLSFRDDSMETAMMDTDANGFLSESPGKANYLLRAAALDFDVSDVGLTRWRIQDADTVLEIMSDQALPSFTSTNWD